jgi:hypothetical protein
MRAADTAALSNGYASAGQALFHRLARKIAPQNARADHGRSGSALDERQRFDAGVTEL